MESELKRTPLYETHIKYGGKMVPFAGWEMPVQYGSGVIKEHMAVREACGLFDVSHMGEILVEGSEACAALNHLLTNDFTIMSPGDARYSPMCNEEGGVVDDLIVYMLSPEKYLAVVNAANTEKDFAWMTSHNSGNAVITDVSSEYGQIAVQGPSAEKVIAKLVKLEDIPAGSYTFRDGVDLGGHRVLLSRTGYTGEDGFEVYTVSSETPDVWELLMDAGREYGLIPCGLGARDTLRLEAGMPLYGHEMDDTVTPIEAGLKMFVKMDKPEFVGKAALEAKAVPERRKVGLEAIGRGILREHMAVYKDGKLIGHTTSGTKCPYINKVVAAALVDSDARKLGDIVQVDVRGNMIDAVMVKSRFYERGASK